MNNINTLCGKADDFVDIQPHAQFSNQVRNQVRS